MSNIEEGRRVLEHEAQALLNVSEHLDKSFSQAVELLLSCKGKVALSGMGKSGQVAQKIASTLSSTGTPSFYLHPAESSHGDLGMLEPEDIVIAISHSGESNELATVLRFTARKGIRVVAITAKSESTLAQSADIALLTRVTEEACPMKLAPTTSSTVTLALGDALAMAVLKARNFKEEDYAEFHPGGKLGRKLLTRVSDVMHKGEALPLVGPDEPIKNVVTLMTSKDVRGVAGVIGDDGSLVGIITDGDIRRRLEKSNEPFTETASELMSKDPKTIDQSEQAERALFLMEQFRIQTLFAVDKNSEPSLRPVGLLHLQDLLQAKIR